MNTDHHNAIKAFMDRVAERNPNEPEFLQAVEEVAEAIVPFMEDNPRYKDANIPKKQFCINKFGVKQTCDWKVSSTY